MREMIHFSLFCKSCLVAFFTLLTALQQIKGFFYVKQGFLVVLLGFLEFHLWELWTKQGLAVHNCKNFRLRECL